jgi:hypothetical protein
MVAFISGDGFSIANKLTNTKSLKQGKDHDGDLKK